ncbi:MAG: hypothetical protein DI582_08780 [Azospirillum brasilense]|nr:MAG: hypothetical protein DI582_08780 [Azospirillum brasilense]
MAPQRQELPLNYVVRAGKHAMLGPQADVASWLADIAHHAMPCVDDTARALIWDGALQLVDTQLQDAASLLRAVYHRWPMPKFYNGSRQDAVFNANRIIETALLGANEALRAAHYAGATTPQALPDVGAAARQVCEQMMQATADYERWANSQGYRR